MTEGRESPDDVRRLYSRMAPTYDLLSVANTFTRRKAIRKLGLMPDDVVLDVGCGTGLSFSPIERRIGPMGSIIGVDLSPDMLAKSRRRKEAHGWDNILLMEAAAEDVRLSQQPNAILLSWVPSVLSSEDALRNLFEQASDKARVVAIAEKQPPRWSVPARIRAAVVGSVFPRYPDFRRPGGLLREFLSDFRMDSANLGATYIACGVVRSPLSRTAAR